jgi:hypothetical protein
MSIITTLVDLPVVWLSLVGLGSRYAVLAARRL